MVVWSFLFFNFCIWLYIEFGIKNVRGKCDQFSKVKKWKHKVFHLIEHIFIILSSFIFLSFLFFFPCALSFSTPFFFFFLFFPCHRKYEWSDVSLFGRLRGKESRSYQVSALHYSQNWTAEFFHEAKGFWVISVGCGDQLSLPNNHLKL